MPARMCREKVWSVSWESILQSVTVESYKFVTECGEHRPWYPAFAMHHYLTPTPLAGISYHGTIGGPAHPLVSTTVSPSHKQPLSVTVSGLFSQQHSGGGQVDSEVRGRSLVSQGTSSSPSSGQQDTAPCRAPEPLPRPPTGWAQALKSSTKLNNLPIT